MIIDQLRHQDNFGMPTNIFVVKSEHLCVKFFSIVSGVSERVIVSVMEDFYNGVQSYKHGLENSNTKTPRFAEEI